MWSSRSRYELELTAATERALKAIRFVDERR
jgi:hypothetical protein